MKKYWMFLVAMIIIMLLLSGCGRDLSIPSSRLVGHWRSTTVRHIEYYFTEINNSTDEGTITEYDPADGTVFIGKYTIFSETPEGKDVTLVVTWPGGGDDLMDFVVQLDGESARMMEFNIKYVDDNTEP